MLPYIRVRAAVNPAGAGFSIGGDMVAHREDAGLQRIQHRQQVRRQSDADLVLQSIQRPRAFRLLAELPVDVRTDRLAKLVQARAATLEQCRCTKLLASQPRDFGYQPIDLVRERGSGWRRDVLGG